LIVRTAVTATIVAAVLPPAADAARIATRNTAPPIR
jgi:hypothetical protein